MKEVLDEKGLTASWLAGQVPCERSNAYNIFRRQGMSVDLLFRLSVVLDHDFFGELSEEWRQHQA